MGKKKKTKYTSIGGQALMEGIMMRGPHKTAMAVRRADGTIQIEEVSQKAQTVWNKIPIIRGVAAFIDSMSTGTKTLMRSAEFVLEDEEQKYNEELASVQLAEMPPFEKPERLPDEKKKDYKQRVKDEKRKYNDKKSTIKERAKIEKKVDKINAKYDPKIEALRAEFEANETELAAKNERKLASLSEKKKAAFSEKSAAQAAKRRERFEKDEKALADKKQDLIDIAKGLKEDDRFFMQIIMLLSTVLGFGFAILLFFFLPTWIYTGIKDYLLVWLGAENVRSFLSSTTVWQSVFEGILKIFIFVLYVKLCSGMTEIKRLFSYHGAEHKTIFCYEAGEELTPENAKKFKRFHPRCGTSFLIIMMVVGIFVGIFIPRSLGAILRPLIKLALVPLIMGIGYELLKLCGRHDNIITKIISAPGMWMQHLTVFEPDEQQLECAIAALKEVIPENPDDDKI